MKTKSFQDNKLEFVKNPYVLEFLGLPENKSYVENDFEQAIIDSLQKFLLEMGKGFAFIERQKLVRTDTDDFYIDLVFYNYILAQNSTFSKKLSISGQNAFWTVKTQRYCRKNA